MAWSPAARAAALAARRAHRKPHVAHRGFSPRTKKAVKYTAIGLGGAAVGVAVLHSQSHTQRGMRAYSNFKVNEGKAARLQARKQNGPHPKTGRYHIRQKRHEPLRAYEMRRNHEVRRDAKREARGSKPFLRAASKEHSRRKAEHFPTRNKVKSYRMPVTQRALPRGR